MKSFRVFIGIMMFVLAVSLCVSSNANGRGLEHGRLPKFKALLFTCGTDQVKDADGNRYDTVRIASQCWMAENLNVGQQIQGTTDQTDNSQIEKYCYDNDPNNCVTNGGLYQQNEMMQYSTTGGAQGICPTGWHIPTDWEWKVLELNLGMTQSEADEEGVFRGTDQGEQIKMGGSSGFQALLSGWYNMEEDIFKDLGDFGYWETSTITNEDPPEIYFRGITGEPEWINMIDRRKLDMRHHAHSIRCVQDQKYKGDERNH